MANVGGRHQYLGGTIQENDEHLHHMDLISQLFLVVMVDTDVPRKPEARIRHGYGISSPQVS